MFCQTFRHPGYLWGLQPCSNAHQKRNPTQSGVTFPFVMDCKWGNLILELAQGKPARGASTSFYLSSASELVSTLPEITYDALRFRNHSICIYHINTVKLHAHNYRSVKKSFLASSATFRPQVTNLSQLLNVSVRNHTKLLDLPRLVM
jgi:hypothetical protein